MKVDPRFLCSEGREVFTGNELLVKGALEAEGGVHLLGGYPGSPVAGFFDALSQIKDLLNEKGIRALINNNEALAAATLNGSQLAPCRSMIVMKSVGVHVAADALALGNLAGAHPRGGAIVVYGDDPWSDSTQVAADSRFLSKHLHIPTFEPSNVQEVKDFVDLCFRVSAASELYAGYVLTTNLADGGGTVECRPNQYPDLNTRNPVELETAAIDLEKYVLLPPKTWTREANLAERFGRAIEAATRLALNRIDSPCETPADIGFATSGLAHGYLLEALADMGLLGRMPILKYGMSYPVDPGILRRFARMAKRIVVVEERRSFLEEQISEILLKDRQSGLASGSVEVWGKQMPDGLAGIPSIRGLHPSMLIETLAPLVKWAAGKGSSVTVSGEAEALDREIQTIDATGRTKMPAIPARAATFCPGCPHRDSASACLEIKKRFRDAAYMHKTHKSGPVDMVFHGDTGCYTMLMYPPNTPLMHDYSGMGLGGGTGAGIDPFITNKQAVFMGDSTFFHSGQLAISQAIKLGQDITFIILDNRTTAMTGHQPTPGVEYDLLGNLTPVQDIEEIVGGIVSGTGATVMRADPSNRRPYVQLLERTFLAPGVKIVIADKECGITRNRRRRREERELVKARGFLPASEHMNINPEICRFCLACAETTGCPGLKHTQTDYGPKMDTDLSWCVADGACERVGACDSFEKVIIRRKRPPKSRLPELGLDDIPEPAKRELTSGAWRCCVVGFGGMGIGVATSILVRAGGAEGYHVRFVDKKGLAIRNGGVVSQVLYNATGQPLDPIIPYGKADLLIGIDVLEAARALDPRGRMRVASKDRTAAVINTDKVSTIRGLMGLEDFDPAQLEEFIRTYTRDGDFLARNLSRICEKYLGGKLYANIMMLGFAFQKGLIPVSMHSMAWAIKDTIRTDLRRNLYAFNMGRKLVVEPDLFQGAPARIEWEAVLEEKCRHTIRRYRRGQQRADALRELAATTLAAADELEPDLQRAFVVRLYDCMRWGGVPYARQYARAVEDTYKKDSADFGYAASRAVIHNLASAMLIKDAVFKAELATSPEKLARDREKYNVNPAHGDSIRYRHLWNVRWKIGPWEWNGDLSLPTWPLRILKHSQWLRKVFPRWRRREKQYLKDYLAQVSAFHWSTPREYSQRLAALASPFCMNCTNPRCQEAGCPLSNEVPRWTQLVYQERWREAADVLHRTNNFPEFTSIVCPAMCEDACKQALGGYEVQAQRIERQIIERAWREGWVTPQPPAKKTGKKVAVVGSGPAGLAAAQQLARAGHAVTVFEKDEAPGGLLRYGIPPFRLEKSLIDRRLEQLRAESVEFRCGITVSENDASISPNAASANDPGDGDKSASASIDARISALRLRKDFDAVLLAIGACRSRDLKVPGREKEGVVHALDFLRGFSRSTGASPVRGEGILPSRVAGVSPAAVSSSSSSSSSAAAAAASAAAAAAAVGTSPGTPHESESATAATGTVAGRKGGTPSLRLTGKIVAVIGGGLTGEDCVQTALQAGAREVHQFEILPKEQAVGHTHADPFEPEPEQITRRWCVATKGFGGAVGNGDAGGGSNQTGSASQGNAGGNGNGKLTELRAVSVQWESSARGPVCVELPETEFRMKVDMAILAVGFEPAIEPALARALGIEVDAKGKPLADGCVTTAPGVFLAGDLASGPSYVATAIASGRKAAEKIDQFLSART